MKESPISKKCFVRRNDWITREIDGETILVPICSQVGDLGSIYTLNEPGTLLWNFIDGRAKVSQMVAGICETYAIGPEEAEKEVIQFLQSLETSGLISGQ